MPKTMNCLLINSPYFLASGNNCEIYAIIVLGETLFYSIFFFSSASFLVGNRSYSGTEKIRHLRNRYAHNLISKTNINLKKVFNVISSSFVAKTSSFSICVGIEFDSHEIRFLFVFFFSSRKVMS